MTDANQSRPRGEVMTYISTTFVAVAAFYFLLALAHGDDLATCAAAALICPAASFAGALSGAWLTGKLLR